MPDAGDKGRTHKYSGFGGVELLVLSLYALWNLQEWRMKVNVEMYYVIGGSIHWVACTHVIKP